MESASAARAQSEAFKVGTQLMEGGRHELVNPHQTCDTQAHAHAHTHNCYSHSLTQSASCAKLHAPWGGGSQPWRHGREELPSLPTHRRRER
jgi:hypothetical protein